jgi:CubicO group peptidase (beta-lactamase class C family)
MTAALAMQQGRLSADDPIRKYLPELPEYASPITVRHLIHHTSGLRDYNTLLSIAGRRGDEAFDNPTVLRITARQKKPNFEPGDEYLYSNTGYTLLALIVERATATSFAEFAAKNIFDPLGMTVTHFHTDETRLIKGRALAFERRGSELRLDTPSNERAGAGGVYTNVRDLVRWDENFYTARIGGRDLIDRLQTPGTLNNGTSLTYAWGLEIGRYRGLRIVEHGGSLGGYRAHLMRFPDRHFSIAILCNLGSIVPGNLARRVADAVLGSRFTEPVPPPARSAGAGSAGAPARGSSADHDGHAQPAEYVGRYYSDEVDATFAVAEKAGGLVLRRDSDRDSAPLEPAGPDRFRFRGMMIRFERAADRKVEALLVDAGRVRDIRFVRQPR